MSYSSVDQLQQALTEKIFRYAKDSKKAAGRALGTIVEIITFYSLKAWGLNSSIAIEKKIPEFGNADITHNVEYSLHPIFNQYTLEIKNDNSSITATKLLNELNQTGNFAEFHKINNTLLSQQGILRNGCIFAAKTNSCLIASIQAIHKDNYHIAITEQSNHPYSIFECKRVGVEEGIKKGPQTIEKAKQGAYVAKSVSSLQKVRLASGELFGVIYQNDTIIRSKPYQQLLEEVINSTDPNLLRHFILTVGVVSNHGNWFTGKDQNKELKVLAQSYDWLIFLTDSAITEFIEAVLFNPTSEFEPIKAAFLASYPKGKKKNQFTKVKMNLSADQALIKYFNANARHIEKWFNIISPLNSDIDRLKAQISNLSKKHWSNILK